MLTAISIFFSFPVEKKEEQIEIWNSFKNSIFIRGIQYSDEKFYFRVNCSNYADHHKFKKWFEE